MGGEQAARTLLQIQVGARKAKGQVVDPAEEKQLLDAIRQRYETQTSPYYAAARLWVDAIIDPADTRRVIAEGLHAAAHNRDLPDFKTGVIQV
jgi:acetyl-CoA carboxylase carboxyltransferase component